MRRLEFTRFCHKNLLYTLTSTEDPLLYIAAILHSMTVSSIILITEVMILYAISKRLVANNSQLKMIFILAGTYSINEFNQNMKDVIKGKGKRG